VLNTTQLDTVLCVHQEDDNCNIRTVPMAWFGHPHLLEPPCMFRNAALQKLEAAGRPFRIVMETASLSGIRAAVQAGLAITCRGPLFPHSYTVPPLPQTCLPNLPRTGYAVFSASAPSPAAMQLDELIRSAVLGLE
jgi:DNA-binding transcriptional LysR family regulator